MHLTTPSRTEVKPQLENALGTAKERGLELAAELVDSVEHFLEDTARPAVADAADRAREGAGRARESARESARTFTTEKAAPLVASGAAMAAQRAQQVQLKADEIASAPQRRRRRRIKLFALAGLLAVVAAIIVRRRMDTTAEHWQPVEHQPGLRSTSPNSTGAGSTSPGGTGTMASSTSTTTSPSSTTDDPGGAAPDEAISDAADTPTYPSTPDAPAEVVDLPSDRDR